MHGPTFMGNPLACAVALKGIEIFERDDYMSKIRHIEQISRQEMENSLTRASKKSVSWAAVPASKSMIQDPGRFPAVCI